MCRDERMGKMDELIKIMSNLTNTIVKYDEQYQNEIVDNLTKQE